MNISQKILTALFLLLFGATLFVFYYQASNRGYYDWAGIKVKGFALAVFYTGLFFILKSDEGP
jgi:hypothetical protein